MKKFAKILLGLSVMAITSVSAYGQSVAEVSNTDLYRFAIGSADSSSVISAQTLYASYGINVAGLGIAVGDGVKFVDIDIAVEKTTLRCAMAVRMGIDADADGILDTYNFEGTATISKGHGITCNVVDASSNVIVQIFPIGATAMVTITDVATPAAPFITNKTFEVNPK